MKSPKKIVKDMIGMNEYKGDPAGEYLGGSVTEREHMKKYGEGICITCGKKTGKPRGYTKYCYECRKGGRE